MTSWQYYPKSDAAPTHLGEVLRLFEQEEQSITSAKYQLASNEVLAILSQGLLDLGFQVERNKKMAGRIKIPVLFGRNGRMEKSFDADAYHIQHQTVLEVEAGRGVTNYQFLKDFFQACVMQNVEYLAIAVRNAYRGNKDFETVISFFDAIFASGRLQLPLKGLLIIGY